MLATEKAVELKCAQCGISTASHRDLYKTPLGLLTFTFQPDKGQEIEGQVHLCRPCTHEILSRRLLNAAGVPEAALLPETWM